jgi:GntR family transcriptional regulator
MEKKIQGLIGFTEEMKQLNREVTNKLLSFNIIAADDEIAAKLFLVKGEEVYRIERVRSADGIPVLFETVYLPKRIFKDFKPDIMEQSLYNYIEKDLKMVINFSIQSIEAVSANNWVAENLRIPNETAVLHITLNTFLDNGHPFEYVKSFYRADQYRFIQHAFR